MSTLNEFVQNYVPSEFRLGRDFTGPRGWVSLTNQLLRRLELERLFELGIKKEVGVEVNDNYWITIPGDCRKAIGIYYPPLNHYSERNIRYNWNVVNGKVKLNLPFEKNDAPNSFTLSGGTVSSVAINDADASEDQWKDYLLVLTDGTYLGETVIVASNTAAVDGVSTLTFYHSQAGAIDSTAGYLTKTYLMLEYLSRYSRVAAHSDEIPLQDDYEDILATWLCWKALSASDSRRAEFRSEFFEELELLKLNAFTPSQDQVRPRARSMPALEYCDDFSDMYSDYIGDDD